ncbi:MAG: valine--tRNA ligase [Rickettsiales bacterium]|nr:valine--tRNA ligase [Rickettsiales bacterium]
MIKKRYNPKEIEEKCISFWEKNNIFEFKDKKNLEKFCIMMPPPNITGNLHMGHALTFTLQDILVRFQRKLGKSVLWQPGTDHAGIATEIIVEKNLKKINKKKKELGRKQFINEVWKWKNKSGNEITKQLKKLGTSIDWSRSRFTMDEGLSKSVTKVFIDLYNQGLIYRDKRLVNWDTSLQTAVSDLEVNQKEINGKLWYIKYKIFDSDEYIQVATTRPETMFGDKAIAIHPNNKKLKKFIGMQAIIPISGVSIPILADNYADPKKGSGAVKITPAHDFNDFLVGKKHNLGVINIFDKYGRLNNNVPKNYFKLDRFEARKKIVNELKECNHFVKVVSNKMIVPIGERSGSIIEPYLTEQWFCDAKKLSSPIKNIISSSRLKFHPENWVNSFNHWIKNIEPWCISRQIWWGHRIPAWHSECGEIFVAANVEEAEKLAKKKLKRKKINLIQDNDVLDTWFSSALWPFSTLGWPEHSNELSRFYPTNVLITGFDIIFFWVARMVMMGLHFIKKVPFENVYIHPLVKDESGKKMSKSKGNVIDPLDIIKIYGADALRFTLASLSTQGRDIKLSDKLVENNRNFITKIWNVARFYELNNFKYNKSFKPNESKLIINIWIYNQYCKVHKQIINNLDNFNYNFACNNLYQFIWNDFCDLYIEFIKPYLKNKEYLEEINKTFSWIFKNMLNLANPFIPFITEEISYRLGFKKTYSLLKDSFHEIENLKLNKELILFNELTSFIKNLRIAIKENNLGEKNKITLYIFNQNKKIKFLRTFKLIIFSIFNIELVESVEESKKNDFYYFISSEIKYGFQIKKNNLKNKDLIKKINFYKKEILFFNKKLENKNFVNNAPKFVVKEQEEKLKSAERNLKLLENSISDKNV